jgi:hypothetical protein
MLGLRDGVTIGRISRRLHRKVLRILRPAEAAVRRLIVIAARGLVAKPSPARPVPRGSIVGKGGAKRPAFPLFEPRLHFELEDAEEMVAPRPVLPPAGPPIEDGAGVDAGRLCRRLQALKLALADLPRQAKRLVRARARRDKIPRLRSLAPMRPGRPPGSRRKPRHEVDAVLKECHWLACDVLWPNTS